MKPLTYHHSMKDYREAPIQWRDEQNPKNLLWVTIEKTGSRYQVFTDEHNLDDFTGDANDATFKTLKEAKVFAQDFAKSWVWCELGNNIPENWNINNLNSFNNEQLCSILCDLVGEQSFIHFNWKRQDLIDEIIYMAKIRG